MLIKCHKCSNIWEYTGNSDVYATCPSCLTKTAVANAKKVMRVAIIEKGVVKFKDDGGLALFVEKGKETIEDDGEE